MLNSNSSIIDVTYATESKKIDWDPEFGPSYTPEEMLRKGVFEGKYINKIEGIPASWKKIPKVLKIDDEPDETINRYKIKSRQPLSVWKKNGWIKTDKEGWFSWYIKYFLGRRLGEEDTWQINRWRSFVARHQGQITSNCKLGDDKCRPKQRQGLLQWAWDSSDEFTDKKVLSNAERMAKITGTQIPKKEEAAESFVSLKTW